MIRLESLTYGRNPNLLEAWQAQAPTDYFVMENAEVGWLIRRDFVPCGVVLCSLDHKTANLRIWFEKETDEKRKLLAVALERVVRRLRPDTIVIDRPIEDYGPVFISNSFRLENKKYIKTIEPWRSVLKDNVFDDEGFIINQGMMKEIPFGWFDTMRKGCGWIAAWNLLKMNGMEVTMEKCAHELEQHAFLGEAMGQDLYMLYRWLKKQGLDVAMSLPFNNASASKIQNSQSGIILYSHARGGHYAAYRSLGNQKIQLYNAVYGKRNHVMRVDEFMKKFTLFPTAVAIYVK